MRLTVLAAVLAGWAAVARPEDPDDPPPPPPPTASTASQADGGSPDDKSALEQMLDEEEKAEKQDEAEAAPEADKPAAGTPARPAEPAGPKAPPAGKQQPKLERRGEISDELGAGNSQSTPQNPRGGQLSNQLRGSLYLSDAWTVNAGLTFTLEGGASPPPGSKFNSSYGGNVALFTVGVDWDPGDHFTAGVHFDGSPSSQQFSSNTIKFAPDPKAPTTLIDVNALLRSRSSSLAVGGTVGYDTAGDSDLEGSFTLSATASDLTSDQRITAVEDALPPHKVYSSNDLRASCAARRGTKRPCTASENAVLVEQAFSVLQTRASAAATASLWLDTDVTLSGDYYFYSDDPSKLGYFGVLGGKQGSLGGGGVPIAPLQWAVRPEVLHRFGRDFSARLWVQTGQYVSGTGGTSNSLGAKLQYKFSRTFRMWLSASGQKDVDVDGTESNSGLVGLGAAYKF